MKLITLFLPLLWIRQIIFMAYMLIITCFFAIILIALGWLKAPIFLRLFPPYLWSKMIYFGTFVLLQLRLKIINKNNALKRPCVYVSKHQSAWETFIFHGIFYKISFVLKKELLSIPIFGSGLKAAESIAIDRSQNIRSFKQVLVSGKKNISKGMKIIIFPEGNRVSVGSYPKFHKTAMMLAKSTGADIVPIAHNSGVFWPKKFGLIKPGKITLIFGKPINPKDYTVDELNDLCYEWITENTKSIGG